MGLFSGGNNQFNSISTKVEQHTIVEFLLGTLTLVAAHLCSIPYLKKYSFESLIQEIIQFEEKHLNHVGETIFSQKENKIIKLTKVVISVAGRVSIKCVPPTVALITLAVSNISLNWFDFPPGVYLINFLKFLVDLTKLVTLKSIVDSVVRFTGNLFIWQLLTQCAVPPAMAIIMGSVALSVLLSIHQRYFINF